jgi:hypothetical protein
VGAYRRVFVGTVDYRCGEEAIVASLEMPPKFRILQLSPN